MLLDILYITFGDNVYYSKQSWETIQKIDKIIYAQFFKQINQIFISTSKQLLDEEFSKINEIIFDAEKNLQFTQINDLLAYFSEEDKKLN